MEEPAGLLVLHHCDNRRCCNPHHLYFGTVADNSRDCVERGRARTGDQSGINNPRAKIDEAQLEVIVSRLKAGWNNKEIAADLPIDHAMVSKIRMGHMWREQLRALGYEPRPSKFAPKSKLAA